jgi:hypothetical protein
LAELEVDAVVDSLFTATATATAAVKSFAGVAKSLLVGAFAVEGGVGPADLNTQIVIGSEVVCGRAFMAAHPIGCAVRVVCALMFSQQGVASGEGAAQVVGEHVGV